MSERLIKTRDLCERLSMGKSAAVAFMAALGVHPISLGVGRGRGNYWLESAVNAALLSKHLDSQPKAATPRTRRSAQTAMAPRVSLLHMGAREAYALLTHDGPIQ